MKTDIEISQDCKLWNIKKVLKKLSISSQYLELYGNYKAKISLNINKKIKNNSDGNLILVTSSNPTPFGEGKTTMSIGIHDALCSLGYNS